MAKSNSKWRSTSDYSKASPHELSNGSPVSKAAAINKKRFRLIVISVLVAGSFGLTYYCQTALGTGAVYTHLFYIPIILASLWWQRKGLIVTFVLAAGLLASHLVLGVQGETINNDYLRVVMFIVVSCAAIALSEQIAKEQKSLLKYQERLKSLASELSLADDRQRRHLAVVLHDGIDQSLYAMKIKAATLQKHDSPEMRKKLFDDILGLVDQTMADARSLTFELCPPVLYDSGLGAAIEWLVKKFQRRHDFSCTFVDDGQSKPLDDDIQSMVFYAVRELMTNAAKHAQPNIVKVSLARDDGNLKAVVEDDGLGFDASMQDTNGELSCGFGLFSIRERLVSIGGQITINSQSGVGTRIEMIVPLCRSEVGI